MGLGSRFFRLESWVRPIDWTLVVLFVWPDRAGSGRRGVVDWTPIGSSREMVSMSGERRSASSSVDCGASAAPAIGASRHQLSRTSPLVSFWFWFWFWFWFRFFSSSFLCVGSLFSLGFLPPPLSVEFLFCFCASFPIQSPTTAQSICSGASGFVWNVFSLLRPSRSLFSLGSTPVTPPPPPPPEFLFQYSLSKQTTTAQPICSGANVSAWNVFSFRWPSGNLFSLGVRWVRPCTNRELFKVKPLLTRTLCCVLSTVVPLWRYQPVVTQSMGDGVGNFPCTCFCVSVGRKKETRSLFSLGFSMLAPKSFWMNNLEWMCKKKDKINCGRFLRVWRQERRRPRRRPTTEASRRPSAERPPLSRPTRRRCTTRSRPTTSSTEGYFLDDFLSSFFRVFTEFFKGLDGFIGFYWALIALIKLFHS